METKDRLLNLVIERTQEAAKAWDAGHYSHAAYQLGFASAAILEMVEALNRQARGE